MASLTTLDLVKMNLIEQLITIINENYKLAKQDIQNYKRQQ